MTTFENYLHLNFEIGADDCKKISVLFENETIKKGDYFLRSGSIGTRLSFIQSGILRMYVKQPDKEITQWITTQNSFVTDFNAFFYQNPSMFDIQALVDTQLLSISYEAYPDTWEAHA